jgi:type III secretion system YscQ/HrcQ family protein
MTVAPFDLRSQPRVEARAARASRATLAFRATLPDRWNGELPPLGAFTVAITGVGASSDGRASPDPVFVLSQGASRGRLSVEGVFASRLVDAVLGGRDAVRVARALGPAERGVLAGLLGGLFSSVGWSVGLGPAAALDLEMAALVLDVQTPLGPGRIEAQWPAVRVGSNAALATRLARLPIAAPVVIGETRLRASEIAGASPGDAVVFDGVRAAPFTDGASWPARLAVGAGGEQYWPLGVDAGGEVTIAGKLEARREEELMSGPGNTMDADLTAALAAAPVEVVAELGRLTLRGEELAGLAPGVVLTLGASRGGITLRVGGERWAEGEIVDVEGELGVRITGVLRR